jgi:hypothetical protein
MNSKNIKKSLNAKLNKWLENIEDEEIKKIVKDNTIITGGALVSLLTGQEVNDYDVYFKTQEAAEKVAQYYSEQFNEVHKDNPATLVFCKETEKFELYFKARGGRDVSEHNFDEELTEEMKDVYLEEDKQEKPKYRPVYLTNNAITLSDKIQIVIRFWGEVEDIHKNYDFAHCTCAWSSWDNKLSLPTKALECIINKELYYVGSKYPLCSIIRTRKFINRGYHINAGQYLKMCLQLNELDLHNVEVLQDQLVGVDSAYFMQVLDQIKDKQEENENFKVDNSYLFEVINRIF